MNPHTHLEAHAGKACSLTIRNFRNCALGLLGLALAAGAAPLPAAAGDLAGALIGGAIGSQVGKGRGKIAATAAGAYLGSKAGERLDDPDAPGITAGNVAGAVVGGAIGSQFGGGNGRLAATAAGAVIGSNVADRMSANSRRQNQRYAPRDPVYYDDYDEPSYSRPAPQYYRPQPQYLSSEPGGGLEIRGSGY